jgi:hypothetical protein
MKDCADEGTRQVMKPVGTGFIVDPQDLIRHIQTTLPHVEGFPFSHSGRRAPYMFQGSLNSHKISWLNNMQS